MLPVKRFSFRRATYALVLVVSFSTALAMTMPPNSAMAAEARCFNTFSSSVFYCAVSTDPNAPKPKVNGKVGGKFELDKCYILADVAVGWQEDPGCNSNVFVQKVVGPQPIAAADDKANARCGDKCDIYARLINPIINFLAAAVGIVVTIAIVIGGIQYSTAADDPQKLAAARGRIINALLGLGGFILLWSGLKWLLPGA